jgi:predicted metalloprotease with PDZ domain
VAPVAQNTSRAPEAEYVVEVRPASRAFHVTAVFRDLRQPSLDVALPVWTPGVYEVANYGQRHRHDGT